MSMLILTRKAGQSLMIGDDVTVTVIGSDEGGIRLGIEAPRHVPVDREEVRLKKRGRHPNQEIKRRHSGSG